MGGGQNNRSMHNYVTGFWKADKNCHTRPIPLIPLVDSHTLMVCFSTVSFANPRPVNRDSGLNIEGTK